MPSTASPAGNVPSWVPSADEIQQFIDDGREGDLRSLIASRAPSAPCVDVYRLLTDYYYPPSAGGLTCEPTPNAESMARALHAQGVRTVTP